MDISGEARRAASAGAGVLHCLSGVEPGKYGPVTQRINTFFFFRFLAFTSLFLLVYLLPSLLCSYWLSLKEIFLLLHIFLILLISRSLAGNILRSHFTFALAPFCGQAGSAMLVIPTHPSVRQTVNPKTIKALLSLVEDEWGGDHWFLVNRPQDAQLCSGAAVWFKIILPVTFRLAYMEGSSKPYQFYLVHACQCRLL